MVFFTTPELLEIGDIPMTSLNEKPNRTEALKYYRRVADHYKLDIHQYERVRSHQRRRRRFRGADYRSARLRACAIDAQKIVLATGYYDIPNLLNVPGERSAERSCTITRSRTRTTTTTCIVIGAKNSAAIAALELWWTGARVTLIHRGAGISDHVKYWIKPNIENRIKNGEIKAYFHSRVARDPARLP